MQSRPSAHQQPPPDRFHERHEVRAHRGSDAVRTRASRDAERGHEQEEERSGERRRRGKRRARIQVQSTSARSHVVAHPAAAAAIQLGSSRISFSLSLSLPRARALYLSPALIVSVPMRTTGQLRLHSCLHFLGLHLSALTIAMRTSFSDMVARAKRGARTRARGTQREREREREEGGRERERERERKEGGRKRATRCLGPLSSRASFADHVAM